MENIFNDLSFSILEPKGIVDMRLYDTWYLKKDFPNENIISIFSFISISLNEDKSYVQEGMLVQFENWILEITGNKKEEVRKTNLKYAKDEIIWKERDDYIVLWK